MSEVQGLSLEGRVQDGPDFTVPLGRDLEEAERVVSELEAETLEVLHRRRDDIVDGHIDGQHWFLVLMSEAKSVLGRRKQLGSRRVA